MSTTPQPEGQGRAATPVTAQVVQEMPPRQPPRRSSLGRFLMLLLVLAFCASLFMNVILGGLAGLNVSATAEGEHRVQEKFFSHNAAAQDKVAIIPVEGVILEAEDGFVKHAIDRAIKDDNVKAVVLRVDSPGGSVSGSDYLYHHLLELAKDRKIPIVVSMGSIAASGGYYISMAVGDTPDSIFAEPTGFTGSIGVIIPHYNFAGLMEKIGVADDSISSKPLKKMGSMSRPMTKEEEKIFKALVDGSFDRFKGIVKAGRPKFQKDPDLLDKLATGQIYSADQAQQNGLVDKLGFIEDAVARAIELAKLDKNEVRVIRYKPEISVVGALLGGQAKTSVASDIHALLEMTTPRAYYLCTWLPGLGSAKP
jgi:protease-4